MGESAEMARGINNAIVLKGQMGKKLHETIRMGRFSFGISLYYAWNYIFVFSGIVTNNPANMSNTFVVLNLTSSMASALAFFAMAVVPKKASTLYSMRPLGIACSLCAGLGTLLVFILSSARGPLNVPLFVIASVLAGGGSSWVIVAWSEVYSSFDTFHISACVFGSAVAAFMFYFLITALPPVAGAMVTSLLIPASMLVIPHHDNDKPQAKALNSASGSIRQVQRVSIAFFIFGSAAWFLIMKANVTVNSEYYAHFKPALLCSALVISIFFVLVLVHKRNFSLSLVYRLVLPLVMVGFLLTTMFGFRSQLGFALVIAGYTCFDVFYFIMLMDIARKAGVIPRRIVGFGRTVECMTPAMGFLLTRIPSSTMPFSGNDILTIFGIVCLLALSAASLIDQSSIFEKSHLNPTIVYPQAEIALFAKQCATAVAHYKLTSRETDILYLVVRGRSMPHIAERLCVSRSTVKTHIAHIYQKMGVENRQEMLDIIESQQIDEDT